MSKTSVLLIASQIPQQELGLVAHVLQSQGFRQTPASERPKGSVVLCFETPDKENTVAIKFYQEIGAMRLELTGDISKKIGVALGQYMEPLTPEKLGEFYDMSQSDMERRIYAILLVLAYPDATSAMSELRDKYFTSANDATREGIVHGLEFIETPDAGAALEQIERVCKGQELANMARHAIDSLSERGLIRESTSSFKDKVEAMIYEHPAEALDLIEKYEEGGAAPEIRALHARALRLVGRMDDADKLLIDISPSDPDAVEALCERAIIREAAGCVRQACYDATCAIAIDPSCELAIKIEKRLSLVLDHASASNEERLEQFTQALETSPDDPSLRCQRAECYLAMKRPDAAIDDLLVAQKAAPNDQRIPLLLCESYLAIGHFGCALDQATKAQKNHTAAQELEAWLLKPRVFVAMNLPQKALDAIHAIPLELRDDPQVVMCLGIVEELLGNSEKARECYTRVSDGYGKILNALNLFIYQELPVFKEVSGIGIIVRDAPKSPLGTEPVDPFFKRCDACGALTMKRRTYCRECSNASFF